VIGLAGSQPLGGVVRAYKELAIPTLNTSRSSDRFAPLFYRRDADILI